MALCGFVAIVALLLLVPIGRATEHPGPADV
jgi:hypothetical protein